MHITILTRIQICASQDGKIVIFWNEGEFKVNFQGEGRLYANFFFYILFMVSDFFLSS